jgi:hypothetical protein
MPARSPRRVLLRNGSQPNLDPGKLTQMKMKKRCSLHGILQWIGILGSQVWYRQPELSVENRPLP